MKYGYIALAVAVLPVQFALAQDLPLSFSLEGSYILEGDSLGHRHFGPAIFPGEPESEHDKGANGVLGLRYHLPTYFLGLKVDHTDVNRGTPFELGDPAEMGIRSTVVDIEYGRGFVLAGKDAIWTASLRYADMAFWTDNFVADNGPLHEFTGLGVHVGVETEFPLQRQGWSILANGGLSLLDGEIETSARGRWTCTDCRDTSTTALGADLKVGLMYQQGPTTSWTFGYKTTYWSDVNVEYSDNTDLGGNQGTSGTLLHGPFIAFNISLK